MNWLYIWQFLRLWYMRGGKLKGTTVQLYYSQYLILSSIVQMWALGAYNISLTFKLAFKRRQSCCKDFNSKDAAWLSKFEICKGKIIEMIKKRLQYEPNASYHVENMIRSNKLIGLWIWILGHRKNLEFCPVSLFFAELLGLGLGFPWQGFLRVFLVIFNRISIVIAKWSLWSHIYWVALYMFGVSTLLFQHYNFLKLYSVLN